MRAGGPSLGEFSDPLDLYKRYCGKCKMESEKTKKIHIASWDYGMKKWEIKKWDGKMLNNN